MEGDDSSPARGALHEPAALPIESAKPRSSRNSSWWYHHSRFCFLGSFLVSQPSWVSVSALFGRYQTGVITVEGLRTSQWLFALTGEGYQTAVTVIEGPIRRT
ncbi:hypothetical protein DL98DRAFT_533102 [Cadophora sp. DSE1049]|nr:hypothetical protein DL98DRAFT_533102 [Cadophora sp. DSE1049]